MTDLKRNLPTFTPQQLKEVLVYIPETGYFYECNTNKRRDRSDCTKGYLRVFIYNRYYKAHQLAWYYMYGEWPNLQIDHIDTNKTNNAISNLRLATQKINMLNKQKPHKNNILGVQGVSKWGKFFKARLRVDNKTYYGSKQVCVEAAALEYKKMKSDYAATLQ